MIEGIVAEEVESYHLGLGFVYKWLVNAIAGRKMDITRRKILKRKEKEDRQQKIEREEDRKTRREEYLAETKAEWETDNADNIEEYKIYMDRQRRREAGEPVSGDEDEDQEDEDGKPKPPPQMPVFNEAEALEKFDSKEENAIVEIPPEIIDDIDDDWPMSPEAEQDFIDKAIAAKEGQ